MKFNANNEVEKLIASYPKEAQERLFSLRKIITESAEEAGISSLDETLKWGEPSYKSKIGSTIRMDWKPKNPDQYAMYFICTSGLVNTFQLIYGDLFKYEGNRALIFEMNDELPLEQLKHCVSLALTYHKVKHLPMLGV